MTNAPVTKSDEAISKCIPTARKIQLENRDRPASRGERRLEPKADLVWKLSTSPEAGYRARESKGTAYARRICLVANQLMREEQSEGEH